MEQSFDTPTLPEWLDAHTETDYDQLDFGVVKMDYKGTVVAYNAAESAIAGISKDHVKGKHFFTQVAPCTNNYMVAEKYMGDVLDETIPYIFTYITKPTKVKLRLIKGKNGYQYLLTQNA